MTALTEADSFTQIFVDATLIDFQNFHILTNCFKNILH